MDDYYRFAGVVLGIRHENDSLFRCMDDEIRQYRAGAQEPAHCRAFLNPRRTGLTIPEKAVRTSFLDDQTVYSHDSGIIIAGKDNRYVIRLGIGTNELAVDYAEDSPMLRKVCRWLLKWLIIRSIEDSGMVFIHASAAHYNGKNVIFCGDSHCGKSSSLLRLVSKGAKAISDDSVISDGSRLIPFSFKTTVNDDLARRFNIGPELFDIGQHVDPAAEYGRADFVVFLRIWNSATSEARPMEFKRALLNLIRIYKKEIPALWAGADQSRPDPSALIFKKYSALLENAECFEFYAGYEENEVRESLIRLIGGK